MAIHKACWPERALLDRLPRRMKPLGNAAPKLSAERQTLDTSEIGHVERRKRPIDETAKTYAKAASHNARRLPKDSSWIVLREITACLDVMKSNVTEETLR